MVRRWRGERGSSYKEDRASPNQRNQFSHSGPNSCSSSSRSRLARAPECPAVEMEFDLRQGYVELGDIEKTGLLSALAARNSHSVTSG